MQHLWLAGWVGGPLVRLRQPQRPFQAPEQELAQVLRRPPRCRLLRRPGQVRLGFLEAGSKQTAAARCLAAAAAAVAQRRRHWPRCLEPLHPVTELKLAPGSACGWRGLNGKRASRQG